MAVEPQSNKPVRGRATTAEQTAKKEEAKRQAEVPQPKPKEVKKTEVPPPAKKEENTRDNKADNKNEQAEEPAAGKTTPVNTTPDVSFDGIDVSRHQRTIDWDEVAASKKVKYVYIKATEGQSFVDPKYRENIENARRVGIKVGSYHFLRTGSSIQAQFENFTRQVKKNEQDLLPLLDVEVKQGWTSQQVRDSVKLFVDMLEEHYGCKPMIYTGASFFNNNLGRTFVDYPLFIARYASNEPRVENATWTLWQFSDRGRVPGIVTNVDLSRFNKGRSLRDILIKDNKIGHQKRRNSDVVDKSHEKPSAVNVKKEAPVMSKQQEIELKKKQEKEQKARERAEKLAKEEAAKREKEAKEQAKKEAAAREKAAKEKAAKEKAEKQAKERAEKAAQKKVDKMVKDEIERQEKAEAAKAKEEAARAKEEAARAKEEAAAKAKEEAKQKAIAEKRAKAQAKAQADLEREAAAKSEQQLKKQEQKAKLQQQKAASTTVKQSSTTNSQAAPTRKRANKSSADND